MEFALKFKLNILPVVVPENLKNQAFQKVKTEEGEIIISGKGLETLAYGSSKEIKDYYDHVRKGKLCYTEEGYSVNSGFLTGLKTSEASKKMIKWLEEKGLGRRSINYKLRDWLFSRQRYWGEPFPIVHFENGDIKGLDESELPLTLPKAASYKPSGTGESPLAAFEDWVNTTDKETGLPVRRETNTMPQWAGSCWYYLRYIDPHNDKIFCDKEKEQYWMPVDLYIGGSEHAVLHLLYARFWHKVLHDLGYLYSNEPFTKLFNQGMILGEDGVKMSKSRGNVINPDDVIEEYGADSMRLFEMFMGPLEATKPWSTEGLAGMNRFLNRVWRLIIDDRNGEIKSNITNESPDSESLKLLHRTIKKITQDIENGDMKFNTSIAQMMIFTNELYKFEKISKQILENFILILSPFAPHISEELWAKLGNNPSTILQQWPHYDDELAKEDNVVVAFSVNGKVRAKVEMERDADEKTLEHAALESEIIKKYISGMQIVKIIVVKNKMVNVVVK